MPNLMDSGKLEEVSAVSSLALEDIAPPPPVASLARTDTTPAAQSSGDTADLTQEDTTLITFAAFHPRKRKANLLQSPRLKTKAPIGAGHDDNASSVGQENIPATLWGTHDAPELPDSHKPADQLRSGDSACPILREDSEASIQSVDTCVGVADDTEIRVPLSCLSPTDGALDQAEDDDDVFASAEGESEEEEDEDYPVFDPYLFMKHLPPLKDVVMDGRPLALPGKPSGCCKMTLVLDLDETLVHSSLEGPGQSDFKFEVDYNSQVHEVDVYTRPFLFEFLAAVATRFEVVIFTASQRVYAEQLLNILDPDQQMLKHRLYRDNCVLVDGNYVKDLTVLGRDLKRTVIVDNSPHAFGYQIENGIPIESWYDDREDQELQHLLAFLDDLAKADDVRPLITSTFKTHELIQGAGDNM